MIKRAYLIGFEVMTRVVVDVPTDEKDIDIDAVLDTAILKAREQIGNDIRNRIVSDNLTVFEEDKIMPYGRLKGEKF